MLLALLVLLALPPTIAPGGEGRPGGTVRVQTAAELSAALLAARAGHTIELAPGRYQAPASGFRVPSNVGVVGAWPGRNRLTGGSVILPASADHHAVVLLAGEADPAGNVRIERLIVRGRDSSGTGCGFILEASGTGTPSHIEFVDCMAWGVGSDGFRIRHASRSVNAVVIERCTSNRNGRDGFRLERLVWPKLSGLYATINAGSGLYLKNVDLAVVADFYAQDNAGSQIVLDGGMGNQVIRGVCEGFGALGVVGVELRGGREPTVEGVRFLSGSPVAAPSGTGILGVGCDSPWIGRCMFRAVLTQTSGIAPGDVAPQDVSRN